MIPRPSSESQIPRAVKGKAFQQWFTRHFYEGIKNDIMRWEASNTPGSSKKRLIERLRDHKGRQGFMKIGKEH